MDAQYDKKAIRANKALEEVYENCIKLEIMPDMSGIPRLQIDGVPEQLADWEVEQKRKRAEDLRDGKTKGQNQAGKPAAAGAVAGS